MNKKIALVIFIIVVLIGAFFTYKNSHQAEQVTPTPTMSESPLISVSPSITPVVTKKPGGFVGPTGLTGPGTCQISGSLEFVEPNISISHDPKIVYQNIDTDARLIDWHVSPNDDLAIGPNIFVNLDVPSGEHFVNVGLPANPVAKFYTLTASVHYGQLINNNVEVKTAKCTGSISVKINY